VLAWPLRENLRIGHHYAHSQLNQQAAALLERFDVRPPQPQTPARSLSGGNQQKLIVAREFGHRPPAWVLAYNPAHGLDFRATAQLHEQLRSAAARGAGVLFITMDLDEALALGTRFGVFHRGNLHVDDDYQPDRERLGRLMLGADA
jgi:simple sugar transport system ATP-binding protein